jgi:pyroglutamyl-peptidase
MSARGDRQEVLVAGFEPFGGRRLNRSWEVVRRVPPRPRLETLQLPVEYARLKEEIPRLAERQPGCLLLVGESPAGTLAVEQVALNVVDRDRPDNSESTPEGEALVAGAPLALRARWDARAVAGQLRGEGISAAASFHAGTFACNAALFLALHTFGQHASVGFLHVPYRRWPLGIRMPALLRAIEICLQALAAAVPEDDQRQPRAKS